MNMGSKPPLINKLLFFLCHAVFKEVDSRWQPLRGSPYVLSGHSVHVRPPKAGLHWHWPVSWNKEKGKKNYSCIITNQDKYKLQFCNLFSANDPGTEHLQPLRYSTVTAEFYAMLHKVDLWLSLMNGTDPKFISHSFICLMKVLELKGKNIVCLLV